MSTTCFHAEIRNISIFKQVSFVWTSVFFMTTHFVHGQVIAVGISTDRQSACTIQPYLFWTENTHVHRLVRAYPCGIFSKNGFVMMKLNWLYLSKLFLRNLVCLVDFLPFSFLVQERHFFFFPFAFLYTKSFFFKGVYSKMKEFAPKGE